jgi:hypothetical protein
MLAKYVPPQATPASPPEVALAYTYSLAKLTGKEPSPKAVAVLHAQCALETGHMAACKNFSVGNIKASSKYEGLFTCFRCNERLLQPDGSFAYKWFSPEGPEEPKGNVIRKYTVPDGEPQTRFRAFKSLADGVLDKIRFLSSPRWKPALALALDGDAAFYVAKIRQLGYFTSELGPYQRTVVSLAAKLLPVAEGVAEDIEELDDATCADLADCMRVEIPEWLRVRVEAQNSLLEVDWSDWKADRDASMRDAADPNADKDKVYIDEFLQDDDENKS